MEVSSVAKANSEFNWKSCSALFITFALQACCSGQIMTVYEYYSALLDYFGETRSATALVGAVNMAITQCAGALGFLILPRLGYRRCICIGSILGTLGLTACYIANSILHLIFSYGIIFGFGISLVFLGAYDAVRANFSRYLYLATSISLCGGGFGMMIGGPLLNALIENYGWRGAFLLQAGINLQMLVLGALLVPRKPKSRGAQINANRKPMPLKKRCTEARLWLLCMTAFFVAGGLVTFYIILKDLGAAFSLDDYIPAASQALGFGNIIGRFSSGPFAMIVSPLYILLTNKLLVASIPFLFLATANGPGFVTLASLVGFSHGIEMASQAHGVVHLFGAAEMAPSLGYVLSFSGLGSVIMPPLSGYLADSTGDYLAPLVLSGTCGTISLGLILILFLVHRKKVQSKSKLTVEVIDPISDKHVNIELLKYPVVRHSGKDISTSL